MSKFTEEFDIDEPETVAQRYWETVDNAYENYRDSLLLEAAAQHQHEMGLLKHYLSDLICRCAPDNGFAQDAIEYAITSGFVPLSYNRGKDVHAIMARYDAVIEHYRTRKDHNKVASITSIEHPLLQLAA